MTLMTLDILYDELKKYNRLLVRLKEREILLHISDSINQ